MPEWALPILLVLIFIGAVAGSVTGFGQYLITGPLLWLLLTPTEALAFGFSAGWGVSAFVLYKNWRHILWVDAGKLLLWTIPGLALGVILHAVISTRVLLIIAALAIIAAVALRYYQGRLPIFLGGSLAGTMTSSVGFNGPPVSLSLHGKEERQQRATTILVLLLLGFFALGAMLLSDLPENEIWSAWLWGAAALPLVMAGAWSGDRLAHRIGDKIEWVAITLSLLGAAVMILAGLRLF